MPLCARRGRRVGNVAVVAGAHFAMCRGRRRIHDKSTISYQGFGAAGQFQFTPDFMSEPMGKMMGK
jgi:hypothetical protein